MDNIPCFINQAPSSARSTFSKMTDKVHPATKPNAVAVAAAPPIPKRTPTKNPNRPPPSSKKPVRRRRRFCLACFWSTLILLAILVLASVVFAAFYVLYQPQKPSFSVTSLKISSFNLTTIPSDDTTAHYLSTKLNLTLSAKNPNKKMAFLYGPMSITLEYMNSVNLSNGSFAHEFTNSPHTIFIIHSPMGTNSLLLETESANSLKSDLKNKNGFPISIVVDTTLAIQIQTWKMNKIGIRVQCVGIRGVLPMGKHVNSNVSKAKCKLGLRINFFKWTF